MPIRRLTPEEVAPPDPSVSPPSVFAQGRVPQRQPAVIGASWEREGLAVDPGTGVTVAIVRDSDGSTVVPTTTVTGTGPTRAFALTPAHTALLDTLIATWTASDGSTLTTYVEVVGGFLFSIAQARMRSPLQDTTAYTTESLMFYRTLAEMAIEDACGVGFVPRYSRDEATVAGWGLLSLPRRRLRAVRQITTQTNAGPQAMPTLAGLRIEMGANIFYPTFYNWYSRPIMVAYEHGFDQPPPRVGRAALELARRWIVESPWDERTTGFKTRDGGEMTILTASHADAFDIPEVVAVVDMYGTPMVL